MELDPDDERVIRRMYAGEPLTVEKLQEFDQAYEDAYASKEAREKTKRRVKFVAGFLVSLAFGYVFDRVSLALGMPEEWLLSNMLLKIWHNIF
jgi:F0F1-type ATP synthase assembly protein I